MKYYGMEDVKRVSIRKKRGRGNIKGFSKTPPHVPTDEDRELVKRLVAFGNRNEDIADIIGISHDTLTRYYSFEIKVGRAEITSRIANKVTTRALSDDHKDAQRAAEYWLSRRGGWKEITGHELSGPDGGEIEVKQISETDQEIINRFLAFNEKI